MSRGLGDVYKRQVGGVPARVIGTYESAKEKARAFSAPFLEKGLREPCTVEEMLHVQ